MEGGGGKCEKGRKIESSLESSGTMKNREREEERLGGETIPLRFLLASSPLGITCGVFTRMPRYPPPARFSWKRCERI